MDPLVVPLVATISGAMTLLVRLAWHRRMRDEEPASKRAPWTIQGAVADPLSRLWTDLDWFVRDDPRMDYALTDLDRVIALVREREADARPIADALDIEEIFGEMRMRRTARLTAAGPVEPAADPLLTYLRTLGTREAPPGPLLLDR